MREILTIPLPAPSPPPVVCLEIRYSMEFSADGKLYWKPTIWNRKFEISGGAEPICFEVICFDGTNIRTIRHFENHTHHNKTLQRNNFLEDINFLGRRLLLEIQALHGWCHTHTPFLILTSNIINIKARLWSRA